MKTTFHILRPGESDTVVSLRRDYEADLPAEPRYIDLERVIMPLLDGGNLEHVSVLYEDRHADMFVDDEGHVKGLPRNEEATKIYRANWLKQYPQTDPETLPWVAGPAVLFDRRVWF